VYPGSGGGMKAAAFQAALLILAAVCMAAALTVDAYKRIAELW
jgi:hypothetical protein